MYRYVYIYIWIIKWVYVRNVCRIEIMEHQSKEETVMLGNSSAFVNIVLSKQSKEYLKDWTVFFSF